MQEFKDGGEDFWARIKSMKNFTILSLIVIFLLPSIILASIGVGIGTGKIVFSQPLKPGGIYNSPPVTVFNTGDEPSDYKLFVVYHQDYPQLRPPQDWFVFDPLVFHLEPGKGQTVTVKLNLPIKAKPGDYFAILEARPVQIIQAGVTSIGIAAATKLYFSIVPANLFQAITWRISVLWKMYSPWTGIVLLVIILAVCIVLFRKFFKFQVVISKKGEK